MATNNFLAFASGAGSNVLTQADYAALAARTSGFLSGLAKSAELNKVWRQSSIMAAVIGQLINDMSGLDAIDDGTTAALVAALKSSIKGFSGLQRFTSSGSFTVPLGITTIYVSGCAGGGGGGYVGGPTSGIAGGGGGGGAGQSIVRVPYTVTPGQVISVTVGAGGGSGASGGNTVIGSLVTLQAGVFGNPGIPSNLGSPAGGLGGTGYPKGSDGSDAGNTIGTACGGVGASGPFGGGGAASRSTNAGAPYAGGNAYGFGAGGGGAGGVTAAGTYSSPLGGTGAPGLVIIEW